MAKTVYASSVFINCPFDLDYDDIREAIIFAIYDCGFVPRCALEEDNGGDITFVKIQSLIAECKFGVHDICRTELDDMNGLPRFNMPLELGVFIGAKRFGNSSQKHKNCLILDTEQYRYQKFISDIAGHAVCAHQNDPEEAIKHIRNWLNTASGRRTIPGGSEIARRYRLFIDELPNMCAAIPMAFEELTYNDYSNFVSEWLQQNTAA